MIKRLSPIFWEIVFLSADIRRIYVDYISSVDVAQCEITPETIIAEIRDRNSTTLGFLTRMKAVTERHSQRGLEID